jgi:hypothetical protein
MSGKSDSGWEELWSAMDACADQMISPKEWQKKIPQDKPTSSSPAVSPSAILDLLNGQYAASNPSTALDPAIVASIQKSLQSVIGMPEDKEDMASKIEEAVEKALGVYDAKYEVNVTLSPTKGAFNSTITYQPKYPLKYQQVDFVEFLYDPIAKHEKISLDEMRQIQEMLDHDKKALEIDERDTRDRLEIVIEEIKED